MNANKIQSLIIGTGAAVIVLVVVAVFTDRTYRASALDAHRTAILERMEDARQRMAERHETERLERERLATLPHPAVEELISGTGRVSLDPIRLYPGEVTITLRYRRPSRRGGSHIAVHMDDDDGGHMLVFNELVFRDAPMAEQTAVAVIRVHQAGDRIFRVSSRLAWGLTVRQEERVAPEGEE